MTNRTSGRHLTALNPSKHYNWHKTGRRARLIAMGSDCFCAICGGPFRAPAWLDDDDEQDRYDETVLPRDSPLVGWVEDVRLIGENPASKGLDK